MQFRLRPLLYGIAFLCLWFAVFSYMAFHRPVKFYAHGHSWDINGPIGYWVWVAAIPETDGTFEDKPPSGVNLVMFGTAGARHNDDPAPATHGTKHTFPIRREHELQVAGPDGKRWLYRFKFPKKPMRAFASDAFLLMVFSTAVTVATAIIVRKALALRKPAVG